MKLTVDQKALADAVATVSRAVERRNTIPIHSNVHLEASTDTLRVTGTDLDIELSASVTAEVKESGLTTISATAFSNLAKSIPRSSDGTLRLQITKKDKLQISTGRSKFELFTLPAIDFPIMLRPDKNKWSLKLSGAELTTLFGQVDHCICKEEARFYLTGIHLTIEGEETDDPQLVAVATNGHHLAKTAISAPKGALATKTRTTMPGIIVPEKTVRLLCHILGNKEGPIDLIVTEEKIELSTTAHRVTSKLIDGAYPDYQRVIPSGDSTAISINPQTAQAAVDFVKSALEKSDDAVVFSLSKGVLLIETSSNNIGDASDELAIDYDGEDLRIGFAAEYLSANLAKCDCEVANIYFGDAGSPIKIIPQTDRATTLVIMPKRV